MWEEQDILIPNLLPSLLTASSAINLWVVKAPPQTVKKLSKPASLWSITKWLRGMGKFLLIFFGLTNGLTPDQVLKDL